MKKSDIFIAVIAGLVMSLMLSCNSQNKNNKYIEAGKLCLNSLASDPFMRVWVKCAENFPQGFSETIVPDIEDNKIYSYSVACGNQGFFVISIKYEPYSRGIYDVSMVDSVGLTQLCKANVNNGVVEIR